MGLKSWKEGAHFVEVNDVWAQVWSLLSWEQALSETLVLFMFRIILFTSSKHEAYTTTSFKKDT